ncbi:MAG TPA: hypothetical protein VHZ24_04700 [Pirellulales bacterium]|nr:hypothetical protein [Pirellulales bacterium]
MACSRGNISLLSMAALVLLRISIGWHFLYAGLDKLTSSHFTSAGFLGQAKGPLAEKFHDLVPDWDGRERFGAFEVKIGDERIPADEHRRDAINITYDRLAQKLHDYEEAFEHHYRLTPQQAEAVEKAYDQRKAELKNLLTEKATDIENYFHDLGRLEAARERKNAAVPFEQKRAWDAQTGLRASLTSWERELDRIQTELAADLHALLDPVQQKQGDLPRPLADWFTTDHIITYTNIAIGLCLMLGLFTRLAALGGAVFLASIVLASPDWPGLYPPPPPSAGRTLVVGKEFIEMIALFALATLPVGRWAGLDFFIHHLLVRPVYRTGKAT